MRPLGNELMDSTLPMTRMKAARSVSYKEGGMLLHRSEAENCLLCEVLARHTSSLPWHDRPLMRLSGIGAAIPGLGAFVPGYVLVFPEKHIYSTLSMPSACYDKFQEFCQTVLKRIEQVFGPTTIFEHGSCSVSPSRRSACIDHAHLHLIPGTYSLNQGDLRPIQPTSHTTPRTPALAQRGYLLLAEPGRPVQHFDDPGVSQYFRRKIAAQLGYPDEWDYLLFPRMRNVEHTMCALDRKVA